MSGINTSPFKPRRGKTSTMLGDKKSTLLKEGEFFVEVPDDGVGKGHSKIKIGDGVTAYSSLPYALGDTSNDNITFTDNDTSTDVNTAVTNVASGRSLGGIIASIKNALKLLGRTATQSISGLMSAADKKKLDGIESGAQKNTVTGIKGDAESTYRTGNVNITKANIGLGNVDNTADSQKVVKSATNASTADYAKNAGSSVNATNASTASYANVAGSANAVAWDKVSGKPSTYTPSAHTHTSIESIGLTNLANQDLNNYKSNSVQFLFAGGTNSVANKPAGVTGFGVYCYRSAEGYYTQELVDTSGNKYVRFYDSNSWQGWKKFINETNVAGYKVNNAANADKATNATHASNADSATNATNASTATYAKSSAQASKFATARTITLGGAVASTATSFDGTTNITIPVTSVKAENISGVIGIEHLPQGALERLVVVADDTARFKLTTAQVQLGDTVKVTSTNMMYYVIDESKLSSEAGYSVYTASTATSVPWSGVTGRPVNATQSKDGFMSSVDKQKLDNIASYKVNNASTADYAKNAGSASSATKATQDGAGQTINSTYIKSLGVSGRTVTVTKGNGTTSSFTTQDTTYTNGSGLSLSNNSFSINQNASTVSYAKNAGTASTLTGYHIFGKMGGGWSFGRTQTNAPIQWTTIGTRDNTRYDPIMWGKDNAGNIWNFGWMATGGIGFGGYRNGTTANALDGSLYFDPANGVTHGTFSGNLSGTATNATNASTANYSKNAGTATYSSKAGNASIADNSTLWGGYTNQINSEDNTDTWIPVVTNKVLKHTTKANIISPCVQRSGDTMAGSLNFANGTQNKVGDDVSIGDINLGGSLGVMGLNNETAVFLAKRGSAWTSTVEGVSLVYDSTDKCLSFKFQ